MALRQAAALMLLAALPAVGSWAWQRQGSANASGAVGGPAATKAATADAAAVDATGRVSLAQTTVWGKSVLWVDARSKTNFERDHIPGALLLNEDDWEGLLPVLLKRWTPDRRVVVYCGGGACQASEQVRARLRDAGVSPVYVLHGGWPVWEKEGKINPQSSQTTP